MFNVDVTSPIISSKERVRLITAYLTELKVCIKNMEEKYVFLINGNVFFAYKIVDWPKLR